MDPEIIHKSVVKECLSVFETLEEAASFFKSIILQKDT